MRRPEGHALRGHVGELHGQCSLRRHANSLTLENHSRDGPWWSEVVEGLEKPIVNQGWITVPGKPGLGVTLNEDVVRRHLMPGTGYFESTTELDHERSWDRGVELGGECYL